MNRHLFALVGASLAAFMASPSLAQSVSEVDDAVEPQNTAGLPADLRPIDDALVGGLMNNPTDLDWAHYGIGHELVVDESYPGGGAAVRIAMGAAANDYAGGMNIPLLARVNSGDRLTVGFYARTIESSAENGMGKVKVRFQENREPYPGFGDTVLEIGTDWDWHEVTALAERAMRRDGIVALQFGLAEQTLEIGQAVVVRGPATVR